MADDPTIVEGVGAAATVRGNPELGKRLEAAMSKAVADAMAEGISMDDTETIKARMMAARAAVFVAEAQIPQP